MDERAIYRVEEVYYDRHGEINCNVVTENEYFEDKSLAEDYYNMLCNEIKSRVEKLKGVIMDCAYTDISIDDIKDPYENDMVNEVNDIDWEWVKEFKGFEWWLKENAI